MKKIIIVGVMIVFNVNIVASEIKASEDKNGSKVEQNTTKKSKRHIIDLDKEIKDDGLKGGVIDTIKGFISLANNDEVSFVGKELFIATPIKLYINGKLNETAKFVKGVLTIKTSELAVGDTVTIKNRFSGDKPLVEKKVIK